MQPQGSHATFEVIETYWCSFPQFKQQHKVTMPDTTPGEIEAKWKQLLCDDTVAKRLNHNTQRILVQVASVKETGQEVHMTLRQEEQ